MAGQEQYASINSRESIKGLDLSLAEGIPAPVTEFDYWGHLSLNKGDVLIYQPSEDWEIVFCAIGDEEFHQVQADGDDEGELSTYTYTVCKVWIIRSDGTFREVNNAEWCGREFNTCCMEFIPGPALYSGEETRMAQRPPDGTKFIKIEAQAAERIQVLGFTRQTRQIT